MALIKVGNSFHGTEAKVDSYKLIHYQYISCQMYGYGGKSLAEGKKSERYAKRLRNKLCGSDDCTCSNDFGIR